MEKPVIRATQATIMVLRPKRDASQGVGGVPMAPATMLAVTIHET